ncbi:hypothetical protein SDC9_146441 [bioreactor metagenome]|uniref:Uncharacterized protein n=1 Tax=bioreactor metagenome TaxID=1076179 RepID=A0A645EBN6_9ZZZZ
MRQSFEEAGNEIGAETGQYEYHGGHAKAGNGADDAANQGLGDAQQIIVEAFAPGAGVREAGEYEADPLVGEQTDDQPAYRIEQAQEDRVEMPCLDQLRAADVQASRLVCRAFHEAGDQPGAQATDARQQRDIDRGGGRGNSQGFDDGFDAARLAGFSDDLLQALAGLPADLVDILMQQRVDVARRDDKDRCAAQNDQLSFRIVLDRDDEVASLLDSLGQRLLRAPGAGGGWDTEEFTAKDEDGAVENDQRHPICRRLHRSFSIFGGR